MPAKKSVPYNEREKKVAKKAFKATTRSVSPVAKDTNKTRRKIVKPTKKIADWDCGK